MGLDHALRELRRRNAHVPSPARLPSLAEVDALEISIGVAFHPDFRRYLLEASDVNVGTMQPVTAVPSGRYRFLPNVIESARAYGVPVGLVPICEDNADFYCMNGRGEVVFWSHDGTTDEKWPDLAAWIEQVWIRGE